MKRDFYHLIINGEQVKSSTWRNNQSYNPATGEFFAEVAKAIKRRC